MPAPAPYSDLCNGRWHKLADSVCQQRTYRWFRYSSIFSALRSRKGMCRSAASV